MAIGLRAAFAPSLSERRGFSIASARDAMIAVSILLLLAASAADSTAVPVQPDSVIVLPEVRVEGARETSDARRRVPTASVSEHTTGTSGRALETIADVLGEISGVSVRQYGGLGAFSTVSLRGAPPGQVAIFLDGAPISSAGRGVVSLGDLPAEAIERVEVYRGLSPLTLGLAAPGGAINLVTAAAGRTAELRLARGAFDTWEGRARAGGEWHALSGVLLAGYQGSRGDFRYVDDNGTPFNTSDDSLSTRANNRFDGGTLLAHLTWRPRPDWIVVARENLFRKAQGVPGIDAVPAYATHLTYRSAHSQLEATRAGSGAVPTTRARAGLGRERSSFRDPAAELGIGRHDTDDRLGGEDASFELEWARLPHGLSFAAGGSLRAERARLADAADGYDDPPPSRRTTAGAVGTLQWRPWAGRLVVHAAMRRDRLVDALRWVESGGLARTSEVRRTLDAPQAGVRFGVRRGLELRANWASARRAPDFLELFGNQGSVLGNPGLKPERGHNWDAGGSWTMGRVGAIAATVDVAHFASRTRDLVVYVRHSQSSVRAENVSVARIDGEELSVRLDVPAGLGLTAEFTHMRTRDQGPVPYWSGRRLPLRPEAQGALRLDWRRGAIRVVGDLQYIGDDYRDRANLQRVAARALTGASVAWTPHPGNLRFTVEGKNLGDQHIADVGGFPLPGRAYFASCDVRLGADGGNPK